MPDEQPDPIPVPAPEVVPEPEPPEEDDPPEPELTGKAKITAIRADFCYRLFVKALEKGKFRKGDIKRVLKAEFGISARTCETYLKLARERYHEDNDADHKELLDESLGFYRGVVANERVEMGNRIRARERIDKLLCLEKPEKREHSGSIKVEGPEMVSIAATVRKYLFENPGAKIVFPSDGPSVTEQAAKQETDDAD